MIMLRRWVDGNVRRPLAAAAIVVVVLQVASASVLLVRDRDAHDRAIEQVVEAARFGIQQHNRPLIDSALSSALHSGRFAFIGLCGRKGAELVFPPRRGDPCAAERSSPWSVVERRKLAVTTDHALVYGVHRYRFWLPTAGLVAMNFGFLLVAARILIRAGRRFSLEVLDPLTLGIHSDIPLAITELEELRMRNREYLAMSQRQAVASAMMEISTQVAHDIRSPLAALKAAISGQNPDGESRGGLIGAAIERIASIAEDLLARSRDGVENAAALPARVEERTSCVVPDCVEGLLAEKRIGLGNGTRIDLEWARGAHDSDLVVRVGPAVMKRVFSNIIQNAIEALDGRGTMSIRGYLEGAMVVLEFSDTGKGISPDLLGRIAEKGVTLGKEGGNGLGLYHARRWSESEGGELTIRSQPGEGTTIVLKIPQESALKRSIGEDAKGDSCLTVLVDDDALVRMAWKTAAKRAGAEFRAFGTPEAFFAGEVPTDAEVCVDWQISKGETAEAFVWKLAARGYANVRITTGHEARELPALPVKTVVGKEPPWG